MIGRAASWARAALAAGAVLATLALPAASPAASMVVQPDGKIIVPGGIWPAFGALSRLLPDGSLDQSFGTGGFVIDRRLPSFQALALQPDGRIVGAAVGGLRLARYLPDGSPDPTFAVDGVGGSDEADQPHFIYGGYGPSAVIVQPGGSIVVGGTRSLGAGNSEAIIRRYDASGGQPETVGRVPQPSIAISSASLDDFLEAADGSFLGVGETYADNPSKFQTQPFLARFVPGTGVNWDAGFGAGAGLARVPVGTADTFHATANALAANGDALWMAGEREGTFLLARFGRDGVLDRSFGEGGFVAPSIPGVAVSPYPGVTARFGSSSAQALAVTGDGIVLGGGTSSWSKWIFAKLGAYCTDCPQPLLARFDAAGRLDPSFGTGGLLHLVRPDGGTLKGLVRQVVSLSDGKLLVAGASPDGAEPFVARLNRDGSYDPSFGQGGLTTLAFPCAEQPGESLAQRRRAGCLPSAQVEVQVHAWHSRHPALVVRVTVDQSWAGLAAAELTLPRGIRLAPGFKRKTRLVTPGSTVGAKQVGAHQSKHRSRRTNLQLEELGRSGEMRVTLRRGSFHVLRHLLNRRPKLRATLEFSPATWDLEVGPQTVTRPLG